MMPKLRLAFFPFLPQIRKVWCVACCFLCLPKLDNKSLRIALGLRLGDPRAVEHACVCGSKVDVFGTHGLSCRHSGGRIPRHAAVNETIHRALVSGGVPAVLEPVGVCCDDSKRPDGMSLIPWSRGLPLLWDFTCSDTLAHLICPDLQVVPAGWQTLQNQPRSAKLPMH